MKIHLRLLHKLRKLAAAAAISFFKRRISPAGLRFPGISVGNGGQNNIIEQLQVKTPFKKFAVAGFSMLEIIMVMAVSAIIMTCLFDIYNQTARNMARVERFVFEDTQILTLKNRFGKDVAGLSAIWFKQAELEVMLAAQEKKEAPKDFKKRSFYFYSTNKGEQFELLTFITTNALRSYGKVFDRFVRVVYKLEVDPAHEGLFRLMRKEIAPATEFIDEKALGTGKFYELIGGIKSLEITYQLVDRVELNKQFRASKMKKDDTAQDDQKETKQVIRTVKKWTPLESVEKAAEKNAAGAAKMNDAQQNADEKDEDDLGGAPVPRFIEIKIVFGQTQQQQEQEYTLGFYVPSTVDNMPRSIFAVRPTPQKAEKGKKTDDATPETTPPVVENNADNSGNGGGAGSGGSENQSSTGGAA